MGSITKEDIEFYKFIQSSVCDDFWEKDERGNRIKLVKGWEEAQKKYDQIVNAKDVPKSLDFPCVRP